MAVCEVCGNDYDKPLEVTRNGETHVFDSFECAMCAHCASEAGVTEVADRA